jgi:hypothetical protein
MVPVNDVSECLLVAVVDVTVMVLGWSEMSSSLLSSELGVKDGVIVLLPLSIACSETELVEAVCTNCWRLDFSVVSTDNRGVIPTVVVVCLTLFDEVSEYWGEVFEARLILVVDNICSVSAPSEEAVVNSNAYGIINSSGLDIVTVSDCAVGILKPELAVEILSVIVSVGVELLSEDVQVEIEGFVVVLLVLMKVCESPALLGVVEVDDVIEYVVL